MSQKSSPAFAKRYGHFIYPVLFGLFPLMSFYGANASEIRSGDFAIGTFVLFNLIVLVLAWGASFVATRNPQKASLLSVAILAVFFGLGRAIDVLQGTPLGRAKLLAVGSLLFLALCGWGVRKLNAERVAKAGSVLLVVGSVLVVSTLISIVPSMLSGSGDAGDQAANTQTASGEQSDQAASGPDVYYILLDGYGRADQLKDRFDYDNSSFINSLGSKGFYVADKSTSNYAHTHFSVPSTFNMKYLNDLADKLGESSTDRSPLKQLTQHSEVTAAFKQMGYKYVGLGTQWDWTLDSPETDLADKSISSNASTLLGIDLDEFAQVYLQTTALRPFVAKKVRQDLVARTLGAFEKTAKIAESPEKTLTFTHIVSPHPPYLFDENGVIPGQTQLELDNQGFSDRDKFLSQTTYVNKLVSDLVDDILAKSSEPPIIIIASDHGPSTGLPSRQTEALNKAPDGSTLTAADKDALKLRMANLNAYYFPDKNYGQLNEAITPVNSFRTILRQYFGQNLEPLPDRSYFSDNKANEYKMFDVTGIVGSEGEE